MKAATRISKDERRREIIEAATREFAVGGLHGTPVGAIAKRVGVSQPYLFQLFGTKKELFLAAVRRSFERTVATFRTAAAVRNVPMVRSNVRRTAARKSSFLVPKSWKR